MPDLSRHHHTPASVSRTLSARLEEARGLAEAVDLEVVEAETVPVSQPRPATLLGSGRVEILRQRIEQEPVELVFVDAALSPGQQRNLEKVWNTKVIDRTGLILEIFGRRARTREGSLQVELAHLTYQKSRLVRSWTHLERQRGGFGFLGGPGETQIEADRRMITERIVKIRRELEQVIRTRSLHRTARERVPYPVVALVGYTNAGKSTLFNRLTGASVQAQDMLFATLDPTLRALHLPQGTRAILSDTVGFISNLPPQLVAAFCATLEEVVHADLILHVRDVSHDDTEMQARDVEGILKSLSLDHAETIMEIWNKVDLLETSERDRMMNLAERQSSPPVLMSALTGEGAAQVLERIETCLSGAYEEAEFTLDSSNGAGLAYLHRMAQVVGQKTDENGTIILHCRILKSRTEDVTKSLSRISAEVP